MKYSPIPEEAISSLKVDCSAFGLTIRLGMFNLHSYTDSPVPKKPKDLARCHMMNQSLLRVFIANLRNPNPGHPFFRAYGSLNASVEGK